MHVQLTGKQQTPRKRSAREGEREEKRQAAFTMGSYYRFL